MRFWITLLALLSGHVLVTTEDEATASTPRPNTTTKTLEIEQSPETGVTTLEGETRKSVTGNASRTMTASTGEPFAKENAATDSAATSVQTSLVALRPGADNPESSTYVSMSAHADAQQTSAGNYNNSGSSKTFTTPTVDSRNTRQTAVPRDPAPRRNSGGTSSTGSPASLTKLEMQTVTTAASTSSTLPAETSPENDGYRDVPTLTTEDLVQCLQKDEPLQFHVLTGRVSFSAVLKCGVHTECRIMMTPPDGMVFDMHVSLIMNQSYVVQLYFMNRNWLSFQQLRWSVENYHVKRTANFGGLALICGYALEETSVDLSLNFTTIPRPRLEINFTSPTTGYIQSPGWDGITMYPPEFNDSVRVDVPTKHSIMVSFLHLKIISGTLHCYSDKLEIEVGESTTRARHLDETLCSKAPFPKPRVFNTDVLLFRFTTNGHAESLGFKLLFSFHHESAVPAKTASGLWNCSVDYWPHFQQHVGLCNLFQNCYGGEDEANCSLLHGDCGPDSFSVRGRCYVFLVQDAKLSWVEAENECARQGAYLASLNSPEEWEEVSGRLNQLIESQMADRPFDKDEILTYVGLRMSGISFLDVYRKSFRWSDESPALYFKLEGFKHTIDITKTCFHIAYGTITAAQNTLRVTGCSERIAITSLCEKRSPGNAVRSTGETPEGIPLPLVEWPGNDRHVTCPTGHVVWTFLACDLQSQCWAQPAYPAGSSCQAPVTPLPPSFQCANGIGRVPYTLVCDHRPDCGDNSDENFCFFPLCQSKTVGQFQCDNKQCVLLQEVCDLTDHCLDGSDELSCERKFHLGEECLLNPTLTYCRMFEDLETTPAPPALVTVTSYGFLKVESLVWNETHPPRSSLCPDTHFLCPGKWTYCLPLFLRCNGVHDCPGRQDEVGCDSYVCPGFYRCRASTVCVHSSHVCDGVFQCPQRDDELLCDSVCPENCTCYGLAFFCSGSFVFEDHPDLRFLDGRGSGVTPELLTANTMLVSLNVAECGLTNLTRVEFPNLRRLDVSRNHLRTISAEDLVSMKKLQVLSLAGNPLTSLFVTTRDPSLRFPLLQSLDVSDISLITLNVTVFSIFPGLLSLNLSGCGVERLERGFRSLASLKYLDVKRCPMQEFPSGVLGGLVSLREVWADNYKLCCPANLPESFKSKCHAPSDEISSCEALLRSNFYRIVLVVLSVLALLGNFGSFVYRVFISGRGASNLGFDTFVTHLCVSDFLMGVYLAMIGIADRVFMGNYPSHDTSWKRSVACNMAGFLSLLSSEVSAFIICLITFERFLVLRFPFNRLNFKKKSAHVACGVIWMVGIILAGIPLLPMAAHWEFYSQNGICIPLPITRNDFAGHDYSFVVMIIVNFVLFILIAAGQALIYWSIRTNSMKSGDSTKKSNDLTIARRLITIAMSDFLCWFPIGLLGVLASTGVPIPGEVNVAVAIIILPVNSAINPFLYTLNILLEKRRKVKQKRMQKTITELVASKSKEVSAAGLKDANFTNGDVLVLMKTWLSRGIVSSTNMEDIIKEDKEKRMLAEKTNE